MQPPIFNKAKTDKSTDMQPPIFNRAKTDKSTDMQPPKKPAHRGQSSILSPDISITGSVVAEGEIQLDGTIEGDVRAGTLTIEEGATVKGEIVAETVVVRGRIVGGVRARQVELLATAHIEGDIVHNTLSIESGATFEGHCRRAPDPLNGQADKKSEPKTTAKPPKVRAAPDEASSSAALPR